MNTLLIRCVGPMQSWDTQSRFDVRTTGREPSKSGVIGLVCAALGRDRAESISDLAELYMGVRVDKEGHILRDFHTAMHVLRAKGGLKETEPSNRYYLADAAFLVGLSGDGHLLRQIHAALQHPHWTLSLGRKACPPSLPPFLWDGLQDKPLREALVTYPWIGGSEKHYNRLASDETPHLRIILDSKAVSNKQQNNPLTAVYQDHPLSFAKSQRRFASREVKIGYIPLPEYRQPFDNAEKEAAS
jgi:CRISPR system Cascade subunit CasD